MNSTLQGGNLMNQLQGRGLFLPISGLVTGGLFGPRAPFTARVHEPSIKCQGSEMERGWVSGYYWIRAEAIH